MPAVLAVQESRAVAAMKMAAVQPQLDKLRKKYEKDPQRLNTEQQKLMRENGVSMFGGCLPMLITMPLFFIFIAAFRQWGNEMMVRLILTLDDNKDKGIELFMADWKKTGQTIV